LIRTEQLGYRFKQNAENVAKNQSEKQPDIHPLLRSFNFRRFGNE